MECREDYRYNADAVEALIRAHLVSMQQYDLHLAQAMENGLNYMAVQFAMQVRAREFAAEGGRRVTVFARWTADMLCFVCFRPPFCCPT